MNQTNSFKIYDASAGSGKTFTLVKAYLSLLLATSNIYKFQRILAITFTNKAVGEMKHRIIDCLKDFSNPDIINGSNDMFNAIALDLNIDKTILHQRASLVLEVILQQYAALNISTIDGFNHRLIRTFAHDLKLPVNFEVELDTVLLLQKAVDLLIAKAGTDKELTKILINFAIEKADDDKSWDISKDLNEIALLLVNENHLKQTKDIENVCLEDFKRLKKHIKNSVLKHKISVETIAQQTLEAFKKHNITKDDFNRGSVWNYFEKALSLSQQDAYKTKLEENLEQAKSIYKKSAPVETQRILDEIIPEIYRAFMKVKESFYAWKFYKSIYKNIAPLSLLNQIKQTLNTIKKDDNKMLISEFNGIISDEIKNQPIPFIYERIGERFHHYFIDEFQDTSELQWNNLIPLIDNTLSTEHLPNEKGTAMIVGDAKQAIYRWRGGKAEQFLGLINSDEPFIEPKQVVKLESNYRSHKAVVNFNNGLFKFISKHCLNYIAYKELYENVAQKQISNHEGFVGITFLEYKNKEEAEPLYCETVLEHIKSCLALNYNYQDLCVLVRKKSEAKTIANYLGDQNIPFTSSDSLLLVNADEIGFINAVLQYIQNASDVENRLIILDFIAIKLNIEDKHAFYLDHIHLEKNTFFKPFEKFGFYFDAQASQQLPLYELAETIIRQFKLVHQSNAYIQFYLETVFEFTQKVSSSIQEFLEYFELNKTKLKISTASEANAVKIMTIHSSKGLEFPVVIYPFVDLNVYNEIKPKEWIELNEADSQVSNINSILLDYNNDFENYNSHTNSIYINHRAQQELDVINVFYVALTRAVERLCIITKKEAKPNLETYQGILYHYLEHLGEQLNSQEHINFGNINQLSQKKSSSDNKSKPLEFISVAKEDHGIHLITSSGALWGSIQEEALQKGNAIHHIMSRVYYTEDVYSAVNFQIIKGNVSKDEAENLLPLLNNLVNMESLKGFYSRDYSIFNETDLLSQNGLILRPDRFVVKNNTATIIDYKTGLKNPKYKEQLHAYRLALEEVGFAVEKLLIVYINDTIIIEEV